ncbi:hypothetical protein [Streptomyces abikoensis]|uniref:Uncharacterized protein n=1 Tax=Streptomyces abikoensis TaxID=97398 RepID=A0ABW7TE55_9ACTN
MSPQATTAPARKPPHHNKLTCYTDYGCRRPECVERYNARNRERLRAQRAGTWDALVDADPVREHILTLHGAGICNGQIATAAGLPIQSIIEFVQSNRARGRGRRRRTSPEAARKITAVTIDSITHGRLQATGTQRRIQALVAAGWPLAHIDRQAGASYGQSGRVIRQPIVFAPTARALSQTYQDLRRKHPEKHGVSRAAAQRARKWAASQQWPSPKYWDRLDSDLIDDPDFVPEYRLTRSLVIAQDAHWLITIGGLHPDQAAARLGVSRFSIDRALREHPQENLQVAA